MSMELSKDIIALLNQFGFKRPTSVQAIAIPKILNHDLDIIIAAPTGSGKTEAAVIPLLHRVVKNSPKLDKGIKILYITPLRALNRNMLDRLYGMASRFSLSVAIWHGDTPLRARRKILSSPPDILITTPESLQILLVKEEIRKSISSLYAVVVDEVQELVSSERGASLSVALERIDRITGRHVRRILLSSPIGGIDSVAQYFFPNRKYDVVYVKGIKQYSIDVVLTDHSYRDGMFDFENIYRFLCQNILSNITGKQVLVFTNTRTSAEELGYRLSKCLGDGIALHHGSLAKDIREVVEAMFRRGDLQIVIATSSLELGIDIGGIDFVVQYLSPRQALKLIQRVGRAGHRELAISKGAIVVPPVITELLESIVIARRAIKGFLETPRFHIRSLDVLAHQIVGLTLERNETSLDEIWQIVSHAKPFNSLLLSEFESIVKFLDSLGLVKCENNLCRPTKRGLIYYLTTNMIPDTVHYVARSTLDGRSVGLLDEEFALSCSEDDIIVLAGKLWRIIDTDVEKREVIIAPIESSELAVLPKWVGEIIPVYRNVAREVCAFIRRFCSAANDDLVKLLNEYSINEDVKRFLEENKERFCRVFPRDDMLVIEVNRIKNENQTLIAFYTCLGSRASEAFSLLINYLVKTLLGISTAYKSHQLGTVLLINTIVEKDVISSIIKKLQQLAKKPELVKEIIDNELKNTALFKHRLVSVAKKFGIIGKNADLSDIKRVIEGLMKIDIVVSETLRELYTEKIDVDEMLDYLRRSLGKNKNIKVFIRQTASPYLEEMSALSVFRSMIKHSLMSKDVMIEIVKRRIIDREVKVFCTSCYYVWGIKLVHKLEECKNIFSCDIECPYCGSKAVTLIEDDAEIPLLKKALNKVRNRVEETVKLLSNEKEVLDKHKKLTDFIMSHGLAGLIALQGVGVGIETAKRILAKSVDLDSLILNIIEQEKTFLRTSKYWKKS